MPQADTQSITADPFALGGRSAEIIVDDEGKALLALVDAEPELGPLARELFEIEEEQGNMVGGPLRHPVRADELHRRWEAIFPAACTCPAATIGGVAWRLAQIKSGLEEGAQQAWLVAMIEIAFEDAARLAAAKPSSN